MARSGHLVEGRPMSDSRKMLLAFGVLSALVGAAFAFSGGDRDAQLMGLALILAGVALAAMGAVFGRP
jgi:drug/metabolite transporter (DMT)-like permease